MAEDLSLLGKRWNLLSTDPSLTIIQKLLKNRGVTEDDDIATYLNPDFNKMHDPYLMHDMHAAVERIKQAINNKERIIIFGDYDVDGITGTAILVLVLQLLGAEVSYRLPHRVEDGYGLNKKLIKECKDAGTNLLITVDCGIACIDEIAYANEIELDVIITDHHSVPDEIPEALAILHPKKPSCDYPFDELTGAGVALKLAHALIKEFLPITEHESALRKFIDLATLGTVADLGPLIGENRIIVKEGLKQMKNTEWEGLKKLQEICGIREEDEVHTNHVSYRLSPRINAAGRVDSPYIALQLFLSHGEAAAKKAQKLEDVNKERQRLTEVIANEADQLVKKQLRREQILIAYHPNWHPGLIGIIAGRLSNKYSKPTIIMEERNDSYIGSARGPEYYNLVEALSNCSKYLENFGGHVQAAGFTLPKKNLNLFIHNMQVHAREFLGEKEINPEVKIDAELTLKDLNHDLIDQINTLRPFGVKNDRPIFLIKGAYLQGMRRVGHERKHLLGKARLDTEDFKFIAFNMGDQHKDIPEFTRVDLACHLDVNNYNGQNNLELQVIDFKVSSD